MDGCLGGNETLSNVVRKKVVAVSSSLQYNDDNIKSAKYRFIDEEIYIKGLLNEPISLCKTYIPYLSNKKFVVIVMDCGVSVVKPTNNVFYKMKKASKPILIIQNKFSFRQVNQFLNGLTSANNRANYLNDKDKT